MRDTETDDGILKSVFVPPFGLQGQELSCHVTWNRQGRLRELRLSYDKGLRCIHVYNVSEKGLSLGNGGRSVRFSRVSENGYVGFVLKSDLLETPDALLSVSVSADFDFAKSHRRIKRTFKVRLFRPDLRVDAPELIRVKFPAGEVTPQVSPRITLINSGPGTAFVVLLSSENSIKLKDFFEMDEERKRYMGVVAERLESLKTDYPALTELIDDWQSFLKAVQEGLEGPILTSLEHMRDEMSDAEREYPAFNEDLADAFLDAFLATFTLDLRFTAWIQTLESTKEQRIVLLNPWASLPLTGGTVEARIALRYFDLLGHEYPEILVAPLRVESDGPGLLPAFEIIEVASRLETKSRRVRRRG